MKKTTTDPSTELRRQADALAHEQADGKPKDTETLSPDEIEQMLHELRVHQIELKMQNEELRTAQEEIAVSRERYVDLYDFAPVGYITLSKEGIIRESNLTAARLLGLTRSALIQQPISRFIIKEDQDIYYLQRKKLFESEEPQTCEVRMKTNDGTAFWGLLSAAIAESNGAPACRLVISDITERKQLEAVQAFLALTSGGGPEESFFHSLARYLAQSLGMDFVCIDRLEGKGLNARTLAVWCDGHFEDNVTYALKDTPCGDVVGKAVCCFPAGVCQLFPRDQVLQDLLAESYIGVTLFGHTGQPIGLIAVISRRPLTNRPQAEAILQIVGLRTAGELERLNAEESLRESEERYRGLLNNIDTGIVVHAPDSSIIMTNPKSVELLGLSDNEMKGRLAIDPNWKFIYESEAPLPLSEYPVNRIIAGKKPIKNKAIGVCRPLTNDIVWLMVNGFPILDSNGELEEIIISFIDITERYRLEAERAKLESQNRQLQKAESLGRMGGAIAHHFNNQLNVVMGNLEMAINDMPQGTEIHDFLVDAMNASRKATEVSGLMLTYLGQSSGTYELMNLSGVFRKSLILLQAAAPKGIRFHVDFPASGPVILGNAGQMQQVLTNLVTNAWEATETEKGAVGLTVKTVSGADIAASNRFPIDWQPQSIPHACLEVTDTGCGIAEKDIEKIFDPFFTTKFTGRGLGLPVVMGIVKAHGGGITMESASGRGAVCRVFIPVMIKRGEK